MKRTWAATAALLLLVGCGQKQLVANAAGTALYNFCRYEWGCPIVSQRVQPDGKLVCPTLPPLHNPTMARTDCEKLGDALNAALYQVHVAERVHADLGAKLTPEELRALADAIAAVK